MAPTAPKNRPSRRTTATKSGLGVHAPPTRREGAAMISDKFINSKSDKRLIKHSSFVNRIEKAHKKPLKRRRPNKKLQTTMEGLADALPDVEELVKKQEMGKGKVEMKSLSHGKGFMKRRGRVEKVERERFGRNLAQIMAVPTAGNATKAAAVPVQSAEGAAAPAAAPVSSTAGRFAAIRNWVNQNVQKHEAFEKKD